jgi:hypothetical protein
MQEHDLQDLLSSGVLLGMAYTQKKAERIITALEKPINDQLLKLWTNPASLDREGWIADLSDWIEETAEIVLRPTYTRPPHIFYYKLLFFEPFGGGAAIPNILRRLRGLHRRGVLLQANIAPDVLLQRLNAFHRDLSSICATRMMMEGQIRDFINDH